MGENYRFSFLSISISLTKTLAHNISLACPLLYTYILFALFKFCLSEILTMEYCELLKHTDSVMLF